MATSFGLFPEGLLIPTIDDIEIGFNDEIRKEFGPNFPVDFGFVGFLVPALSERLLLLWQGLELVVTGVDRDKATGSMLKSLCLLTATLADQASPSTVTLTLTGTGGTLVPAGTIVRTPDTLRQFTTDDDATLEDLDEWQPSTSYAEGDQVTSLSRCYQCVTAGVSHASTPPSSSDPLFTDGSAEWTTLGQGTAAADVEASSVDLDSVVAVARGLTEIVTGVTGLTSAINLADADLGNVEMSDEDLRIRQDADVSQPGTGTGPALRSALLELPSVQLDSGTVTVFENVTNATVDGLPPKSVEAMVEGGEDQEIFDALGVNVPIGIETVGNTSGFFADETGALKVVKFSRPEAVPIYVDVTLTKNPDTYAGDQAVRLAVVAYGSTKSAGVDAVATRLGAQAFVTGVIDVPRSGTLGGTLIATSPSPTSDATIVIGKRQRATYDVARVTVHSSDGEE